MYGDEDIHKHAKPTHKSVIPTDKPGLPKSKGDILLFHCNNEMISDMHTKWHIIKYIKVLMILVPTHTD